MAQEADFYTAEEAAQVLGIPVRQVFGMLCSGELEGHQDEWARWLVPASAVQEARRSLAPHSNQDEAFKDGTESRAAAEEETRVWDAAETIVLNDGRTLLEPPFGGESPGNEETTQESDEAPVDGSTESGDEKTADESPFDGGSDASPEGTVREITERLAAAAARTRRLRRRLELAEATEAALRESLEREGDCADHRENEPAEQHEEAAGNPRKESSVERGEGFWRGLFSG